MGRKVYISSDMSVDERLIEVAETDTRAALMWPWLLTVLDDWGRADASPKRLKAQIFPMFAEISCQDISDALQLYASAGLLELYEHEGKNYIAVPHDKWFRYQTHIRQEKRENDGSRFPARDCAQMREDARTFSNCCASPSPSPSLSLSPTEEEGAVLSVTERTVLSILRSVPNYKYGFAQDLEFIRELLVDFPELDLEAQVKRWRDYKRDKPLNKKSNARLQLRNWMENAKKYAEEKGLVKKVPPRPVGDAEYLGL